MRSTVIPFPTPEAEPPWLARWRLAPVPTEEALHRFDSLPPVAPEETQGLWQGAGLPTGHPLDGLLEALGWFGKAVEDPERVHPLLFRRPSGRLLALEPALMPAGLALARPALARSLAARGAFLAAAPLLRARRSGARIEWRDFRDRRSAALIYSRQPIADHLRRAGPDRLLGLMVRRGMDRPYFFLLTRAPEGLPA